MTIAPGAKQNLLSTELLVDTVQQLSLAKNLESVMHIVRSVARELTGADGATFVLREDDQCYYADEDAISPLWKGSRFPMKLCISGWAMLNKKQAIIEDIYTDHRIPSDVYLPTFVKSMAMVPIRNIDPIGAIGTYWANKRTPTEAEITLLQSLADITAVSMENIAVRNMLEQKISERTTALAESLERERRLNEMKSSFVSMVAHEFRTPLSAILSSISLAEKYHDSDEQDKRERHFQRIKSSVKNLTDIMNDYLSLEILEEGKVVTDTDLFDMHDFIRDILEEMTGMRKIGQMIHYSHTGRRQVISDKKILRNVMFNLLSNAIKYSEKDIELKIEVSNEKIIISVKDQGIGIPEDQQLNIFSKFFRASNAGTIQGTGLGLSIVKNYITFLGGTISFTSKESEGTTFMIQLPNEMQSKNN